MIDLEREALTPQAFELLAKLGKISGHIRLSEVLRYAGLLGIRPGDASTYLLALEQAGYLRTVTYYSVTEAGRDVS